MLKTEAIIIMGLPVDISYAMHDHGHIEWYLPQEANLYKPLLELLLRIHHTAQIEAAIRENEYYTAEAQARAEMHEGIDPPNDIPF